MTAHIGIDALRQMGRIGSVAMLCIFLTSCGLGGDGDDPDPTATTEVEIESQSTQLPEEAADPTETRAPFRLIPASPDATSESTSEATAGVGTPESPGTTGTSDPDSSPEASPASGATAVPTFESEETPAVVGSPELPANSISGSDGTSGASGVAGLLEGADGSPVATPGATSGLEGESCDVVEAPPFTGESAEFVVLEEVNFRTGPGADCDSIGDGAIEVGATLTVLSDPVVRVDDEYEWAQVQIDDEIGWVATEFIEPAE